MEQKRCLGCMKLYDPEYGVCPHCGYVEGTPADETVHMAPGTVMEGRYIIGKVLGYGGFGATYIAWDPVLEQKVAIKEYLPSEFSTRMPGIATVTVFGGDRSEQFREGMEKFVEEAKRLSKFQNEPGIVKIFDSFQANGTAYIIMEYLDGETLTSYLDREGTVSEEKVMEMLLPVMQSLQVVHNEGLLHRDIAPDNIFITKEGNVKLIDFGASRYATTSHSRSLTVIIKPGYSPEEQYRSHGDQGPHTDVYALAAVMYKMLTGMTPPDALERRAMIETKRKDLLPDVHKNAKYVSPVIENAILNAMNIQIEDRTADIPSFLAELQADKPVKRRYGKIKKIDVYAWPLWLKIVIPAVLAASVITGILLATGVIDFPSLFSGKVVIPEGMVEVPNVEQVKSDEALQTLQDAGLTPVPKGNVESSYVEAGLILLQNPSGGTFARLGAQIYLTVSSGGEVVGPVNGIATVPYVVWNTQADAEAKLQKAGLKAVISEAYDSDVEKGMVVSQSLEQGQQVAEGTEITLVVSLGKEGPSENQPQDNQPPSQPPTYTPTHVEDCPFKNGAYADVLAQEEGDFSSCSYDAINKETAHWCNAGDVSYEYRYNPDGIMTLKFEHLSGKRIQYNYNSSGDVFRRFVSEYDSSGNLICHTIYNETNNLEICIDMEYDLAGKQVREVQCNYAPAGWLESKSISEFNSKEKRIREEFYRYNAAEIIIERIDNEFDASEQLKKSTENFYDSAGNLEYRHDSEYDNGNITKLTHYGSAGNIIEITTYDYDSAGNLIKTTIYDADGNVINTY